MVGQIPDLTYNHQDAHALNTNLRYILRNVIVEVIKLVVINISTPFNYLLLIRNNKCRNHNKQLLKSNMKITTRWIAKGLLNSTLLQSFFFSFKNVSNLFHQIYYDLINSFKKFNLQFISK